MGRMLGTFRCLYLFSDAGKWAFGSCFIMCIGMALGELASSAPTSGGVRVLAFRRWSQIGMMCLVAVLPDIHAVVASESQHFVLDRRM